jgi:short-subunit dehydrogenase
MESVFVTGVGSGIGYQVALTFLANNYHVIGVLRKPSHKQSLLVDALSLPVKLSVITADLNDANYLEVIQSQLQKEQVTKLAALINVAGVLNASPFAEVTAEQISHTMHINFVVPVQLTHMLLPLLNQHASANILNITSMSGFQDSVRFPGLAIYGASKAALASFSQSLSVELQEDNIHVNALAIGSVNTQMLQEAFPDYTAQTSPQNMATYIYAFATQHYIMYNGKVLPVAITNP